MIRDLTRAGDPRPIDIPLAPRALTTQADFDRLEDQYLRNMGHERLLQVYELLARDADGKHESDALLLQRLTLLHLDASGGNERLKKVFAWADKLRAVSPSGPHTLYMLGHIKRMLLLVGANDGIYRLNERNRDIAAKLLGDWDALLRVAPDYVGPHEATGKEVGQQRVKLAAALKAYKPPQDVASGTTPASKGGAAAKTSPARAATGGERAARTRLWRFEHGSDAERASLCAERDDAKESGGPAELERWMDLRCAAIQGKPNVAIESLSALGSRVSATERCALLRPLVAAAQRWGRALPAKLAEMVGECNKTPNKPVATP